MPRCHFLLIVTVVAIMLIYKDTKISRIFLRFGFVKFLIFCLFSKVIHSSKYLPQIILKWSQSSLQIYGNLLRFVVA